MASEQAGDVTTVRFAAGVFDIEAIKRAAYRFSDRVAIEIEPTPDFITCNLRPLSAKVQVGAFENEFRNEVLDQDLRLRIAKETEPVRNLILSLAFSKTGLQG